MIGWLALKDIIGKSQSIDGRFIMMPSKQFKYFVFAALINFVFWIAYAINTTTWHKFFPGQNISGAIPAIKPILKESINYPYFYETFALFRETIPIITGISLVLISVLFIYILINYRDKDVLPLRLLSFTFIILILLQNTLNLSYFDTRYFFFLYPLILLLSLVSLERVINYFIKRDSLKKIFFGLAIIPLLTLLEDFEMKHLINIDSKEINFRENMSLPLMIHYYPRWDSETLADIVDKESNQNDIIIANEQAIEFYLNRLDYIFKDYRGVEFSGESVLKGTKERWTNAKLIYRYFDLNRLIDTTSTRTGLILNATWAGAIPELNSLINKYEPYLYHKGLDDRTLLYKITP
jgi:hypothetical protein